MNAYSILLVLHSWSRWLVVVFGLLAVYRAYVGFSGRRLFAKADNGIGASFVGSMHLQLLLGLGLYFGLSPYGLKGLQQPGGMQDATTRFFGLEHMAVMIVAVLLAQVGRSLSKKRPTDTAKHRTAFIYYAIALALVLLMIPWGIWNPARPLFRL